MRRDGAPAVPRRTCVQCGTAVEKTTLLRIAGRREAGWEIDPAFRRPGRGIYLCRTAACLGGFSKRIGTPKGGARWGMGTAGAALAERLAAWGADEGIA